MTEFVKRQRRRVGTRWRSLRHKDVLYHVGTEPIILPPEHLLPYYQEDFPFYDRYFIEFLRKYSTQSPDLCVIDVGANVGDTALAVLSAAPNAKVISVEGSPYFLKYLHLNVGNHPNVEIVEGFVTHKPGNWRLVSDRSTGHLLEVGANEARPTEVAYFTPTEILALAEKGTALIWKTDTDGYDIPILLGWFDEIVNACDVIWIEFDALGNLSDPTDVENLLRRISDLPQDVVVFDNFGHRISRVSASHSLGLLLDLIAWLRSQDSVGGRVVRYFDLWLLSPELADQLCATSSKAPLEH